MTTPVLQLSNLCCERDGRLLFAGLSADIHSGEVVQIGGPNGTGKTSLLRILTGLSPDYEGEVLWQGRSLRRSLFDFRNHLLYIGHTPGVKQSLTPAENLRWYAQLNVGHPQITIDEALAEVGLSGYESLSCYRLSAGQQRRVALARLFLTPAPIWILDEPFTAIDQTGVAKLQRRFAEHVRGGGVVILTTHQHLDLPKVNFLNLLDYYDVSDHYG